MIAYHIDHSQKLKENSELTLFDTCADTLDPTIRLYGFNNVSHWGKSCYEYLSSSFSNDFNTINSFQIELLAESVRKSYYPDKPSRFKSLFAVARLSDLKLWKEYFPIDSGTHIYEIEYDPSKCVELDARFLKGGVDCDPYTQTDSLKKYWSGQTSDSPLPELLISLPVIVRRLVCTGEIIV